MSMTDEGGPTSAAEVVEKHGRQRIEKLAADGNITAQEALNIVDETGGEHDV